MQPTYPFTTVPARAKLLQGASGPTAIRLKVTPNDASFSALDVTSVIVNIIRRSDGGTATWTFAPTPTGPNGMQSSAAAAYFLYTLAAAGADTPVQGDYDGAVTCVLSDGGVLGTPIKFVVVDPTLG